jgi:hypothetical protein
VLHTTRRKTEDKLARFNLRNKLGQFFSATIVQTDLNLVPLLTSEAACESQSADFAFSQISGRSKQNAYVAVAFSHILSYFLPSKQFGCFCCA